MKLLPLALALLLLAFPPVTTAHELTPDQLRAVRVNQQLGASVPLNEN